MKQLGIFFILVAFLSGCQHSSNEIPNEEKMECSYDQDGDPFESFNRVMFEFNTFLDDLILTPVAHVYKSVTPLPIRSGITNVLKNLWVPVTFLNDILQGEGSKAKESFGRFLINSTFGIAGIFDVASAIDIPFHVEDFGQTLGAWGIDAGPYLVLPLIGPTNPRDLLGRVVDSFTSPYNLYFLSVDKRQYIVYRSAADIITMRAQVLETLDKLKETSIDYYSAIRSMYQQHRSSEIRNGEPIELAATDIGIDAFLDL